MEIYNRKAFTVSQSDWEAALQLAEPDPVVHIRHAVISGDESYRIHVAAIPERVGCHYHAHGDEVYEVVAGAGTLYWGKVIAGTTNVNWETPIDVVAGQSFIIPEGYAHQLAKRGDDDLVILFGCPDTHLNDMQDRTVLPYDLGMRI